MVPPPTAMQRRRKRSCDGAVRIFRLFGFKHGPESAIPLLTPRQVHSNFDIFSQIFVRAFDSDERLVGVAFLDVGVYVTSLRSMKNLLLVGDAVKSVMFVAFQVRSPFFDFARDEIDTKDEWFAGRPIQTGDPIEGRAADASSEHLRVLLQRNGDEHPGLR